MLFSPEDLEDALRLLVAELVAAGVRARIQIVGAAAVTMQVGRDAMTGDIDALFVPSTEFLQVVRQIAATKDWPDSWINDDVKMFVSHHDTEADWELHAEESEVIVLVARARLLLAMKLFAGRGRRDESDIARLIDSCSITSLEAARELFDRYYPEEVIKPAALRQLRERFA